MTFDWATIEQALPLMLQGGLITLGISLAALGLGLVIGTGVCAARFARRGALRALGSVYVTVFRGIPLLVQLLFIYYFLPFVGINVPPLVAAIAAVSLCAAAYIAEILRGGFLGIPNGQLEAARILGFSDWDALVRIKLPQALRLTLPALVNELILLVKASSLVSVVGIAELTRTSQNLAASTFRQLEFYLMAALIYFAINALLAFAGALLEQQMKRRMA